LIIFIIGILVQIQPYVYLKEIYKVKRLRERKGSAFCERDSSGTTEAAKSHLWCDSGEGDGADSPTRATKKADQLVCFFCARSGSPKIE
jgi:hypothetical protein